MNGGSGDAEDGHTSDSYHRVAFRRCQSVEGARRSSVVNIGSSSKTCHSSRRRPSDSEANAVSPRKKPLLRYDASHTMDRLRSTFLAEEIQSPLDVPFLSSSEEFTSDSTSGYTTRWASKRKSHRVISDPANSTGESAQRFHWGKAVKSGVGQIPAVVLIALFHLMIGIPFGVSYFPVGWKSGMEDATNGSSDKEGGASDGFVNGPFPLPGKEALGIRMFLYATIVAQIVLSWKSGFHSPIGLEMVENVPFYHELAATAIRHCGYGIEALVTLFFMFGLASVLVGVVFYVLGRLELGGIVYFFPMHVLVGCIGGIGLYIARTGLEVTMDVAFSFTSFFEHWDLLRVTIFFEVILRILERVTLDSDGKPRYALLSPIYFCSITPIFYLGLLVLQVPVQDARDGGFLFPAIETAATGTYTTTNEGGLWENILSDEGIWYIWKFLDIRVVSFGAILESVPTLVALTLFSLIHVPINIPALGISTNTDVDMNNELIAHGYSNFISGICGCGLQNYLAYTQSVVYHRSGGFGKPSGFAVAIVTAGLFVVGPAIASFIPRAMAGSLLLHVGIDLFLEGVYDSYRKFDNLEYSGIWLIVVVMTFYGMEAAMVAGVIAAVSTYAMQSITYLNPIRGSMSAVTLRSSHRNRNYKATNVLNHPVNGRARIVVIQLQGHLFFGNVAQLNTGIHKLLHDTKSGEGFRRIVIMDFSLVVGIDSSAAQGLIKLKNAMQKKHHVDTCIFVTGSREGFPCEFDLTRELTSTPRGSQERHLQTKEHQKEIGANACREAVSESTSLVQASPASRDNIYEDEEHLDLMDFSGSFVLESLDLALIFSENILIAWEDPSLLDDHDVRLGVVDHFDPRWWNGHSHNPPSVLTKAMYDPPPSEVTFANQEEEKEAALQCLLNMNPDRSIKRENLVILLSCCQRETFAKDEFLWKQNDPSDSCKLIISGKLMAMLENEAGTSEVVYSGNIIGELGLVRGIPRMSSVQCVSDDGAILFSLSRNSYEDLVKTKPLVARFIDMVCITYLANRVQHVSNRIFETRCLPI
jgi:sulfate permease, SulP family